MKGLLVRIGIDSSYGNWNAPCDTNSGYFLYISIPENQAFRKGYEKHYDEYIPIINRFAERSGITYQSLKFPEDLFGTKLHLDPDFEHLTYGDNGLKRGKRLRELDSGDFIAFYSSLKPLEPYSQKLVYALVGFYEVEKIIKADDIAEAQLYENAHTRKDKIFHGDIVVRAKPGVSGRFDRYLPIGEYRNKSYRVTKELLYEWGGLSVKDGFIQRNNPYPWFEDPGRFKSWLDDKDIELLRRNNDV